MLITSNHHLIAATVHLQAFCTTPLLSHCFNLTHFNKASPLVLGSSMVYSYYWSFVIEEQQATLGWREHSSFVHCFLSIGYCCWKFDNCIMHWIIATSSTYLISCFMCESWIVIETSRLKLHLWILCKIRDLEIGIWNFSGYYCNKIQECHCHCYWETTCDFEVFCYLNYVSMKSKWPNLIDLKNVYT